MSSVPDQDNMIAYTPEAKAPDLLAQEVPRLAAALAHELSHPSEVVQSNGNTLAAYADVLGRLVAEYEKFLEAFGQKDRSTINNSLQRIRALRAAEDLSFITEDLPALVEESRESAERLQTLATRLSDLARVEGESDTADRVTAIVNALSAEAAGP